MTNHPEKTNFSYERYVTNQLRHYFGLKEPLQTDLAEKSSSREERSKR